MNTRKLLFAAFAVTVMGMAGCMKSDYSTNPYGTTSKATTPPAPNTVGMVGTAFSPSSITVSRGTVVSWRNDDNVSHTSTSDTGLWDTGEITPGSTKTTTFNSAGTFKFHCTYHSMMTGTVVVQ